MPNIYLSLIWFWIVASPMGQWVNWTNNDQVLWCHVWHDWAAVSFKNEFIIHEQFISWSLYEYIRTHNSMPGAESIVIAPESSKWGLLDSPWLLTSVSHPFSSVNSSLGLTGGKFYQKIIIPIFRLILQNFAFPGCFPYILFYCYLFSLLSLVGSLLQSVALFQPGK